MSEPFVGEIKMFAGNFAPRGWALCDGQLLAVSQNDALFSLFGTIYGGDGQTTFGLPEMRGRFPMHAGSGPGLTPRQLGTKSGSEMATVTAQQIPSHSHAVKYSGEQADSSQAVGTVFATSSTGDWQYSTTTANTTLNDSTIGNNSGGTQTHANVPPFLCINFIVALWGVYPSRN